MLLHGPLTYESSHKSNLLLFLYCWIIIFQRIICISNNIVIIKSVIKLFVFRIIFLRPVPRSICCCCCSVTELCPTLYHPMDCSMPGSSVCGILQARILEWVAISFSRGSSQPRDLHDWKYSFFLPSHMIHDLAADSLEKMAELPQTFCL